MSLKSDFAIGAGAVLVVGLVVYFAGRKALNVGGDVLQKINPANPDNIINQTVQDLLGTDSIGGAIYDATHQKQNAQISASMLTGRAYDKYVYENALRLGYRVVAYDTPQFGGGGSGSFLIFDKDGALVTSYFP